MGMYPVLFTTISDNIQRWATEVDSKGEVQEALEISFDLLYHKHTHY
jgi:hypothetical protein